MTNKENKKYSLLGVYKKAIVTGGLGLLEVTL
jgi:hypothetical protein